MTPGQIYRNNKKDQMANARIGHCLGFGQDKVYIYTKTFQPPRAALEEQLSVRPSVRRSVGDVCKIYLYTIKLIRTYLTTYLRDSSDSSSESRDNFE